MRKHSSYSEKEMEKETLFKVENCEKGKVQKTFPNSYFVPIVETMRDNRSTKIAGNGTMNEIK
jgi:hypothetical protein